jgi:hypothetical protein
MIEYIGILTLALPELENEFKDVYYRDNDITVFKKECIDFEFIKKKAKNMSYIICGFDLLKWSSEERKNELLIKLIKCGIHTNDNLKCILKTINDYSIFKIILETTNYKVKYPKDNDLLICFIKKNNIDIVSLIFNTFSGVNMSDIISETCKTGNVQIFKLMTKKMRYKLTPEMLYLSIIHNNIGMVENLLSININYHDNDYKCVIVACEKGSLEMLIYLLEYIKTRNPKNNIEKSLNTGFCKALLNNRVEIIKFMLTGKYSKGDNEDIVYNIPCNTIVDNETTNWLSKKGNRESIELLIKYKKLTNTQIFKMISCNKEFMNNLLNSGLNLKK